MPLLLGIRGANPIWAEFDLSGKIFDDNFYMWVLENTLPYIPATVYHDPNLNVEWDNPIQFLANGTLPNDIYFEQGKVYRLEFRQNDGLTPPTQSDPLIHEVNNYMAVGSGDVPPENVSLASENQVTNPQFSIVNFTSPYTISGTNPGLAEIAPGWFLQLSGAGTITIEQVALSATNVNPSNAPYALHFTMSGWDADGVVLRQRFQQNGMLWANKFVSTSITARVNGAIQTIKARLQDSNGTPIAPQLLESTPVNQDWNEYPGIAELEASDNPNTPPAAYIDYLLTLPNAGDIYITSIQLVVQADEFEPDFIQDSIDRQIDHTFHYYSPQLKAKPIPSLLTAWDFPLNPFQFGPSGSFTNTPSYIADQTIAASSSGSVGFGRVTNTQALQMTTSAGNQAFYIQQYLAGPEAFEMTLSNLAAYLNAIQFNHGGTVCRVYLYYNAGSGVIPPVATGLGTVNSVGEFTLTEGGWSEITLASGFSNKFTLDTTASIIEKMIPGYLGRQFFDTVSNPGFAIVVTFACPTSGTSIVVNSIGLMAGDIATRPAPQTADEVLRECQYYYETSYLSFSQFTSDPLFNIIFRPQNSILLSGPKSYLFATPFSFEFRVPKRTVPNMTFYSVAKTSANVTAILYYNFGGALTLVGPTDKAIASFWDVTVKTNNFYFIPKSVTSLQESPSDLANGNFNSGGIQFHYLANGLLGVV